MADIQIIPTVLATSEREYEEELGKVSMSKDLFEWVQVDFIDGQFANNISVGVDVVKKYPTNLKIEAHLMVQNPLEWIDALVKLGVGRVVVHIESQNVKEAIEQVKKAGIQVGLGLNPETKLENLTPFIDRIDVVLILSVHPGFSGQSFIPQVLDKIKQLAKIKNGHRFKIEVDGGINEVVEKEVVEAGADILIIGEHLTNGNITENFQKIKQSLTG